MLELLLCSLLTILPDYLYRRYVQGKRIGSEITIYSVWYELRWGIVTCLLLAIGLTTLVFYNHPSTTKVTAFFRTVTILPEIGGRVQEVYVGLGDKVEAGARLFKLDSSKQEAAAAAARSRIAETEAAIAVARTELVASDARIQEAQSARQQAVDELETKTELQRRNASTVAQREIERLQNLVDGRQAALAAVIANKQSLQTQIDVLLPSQKASAAAALAEAMVDLDKTVIYAGVSGTVEQFFLRVGDFVSPIMRPAGILVPKEAGRQTVQAGFGQIEAQVIRPGMIAEITCVSKPFTVIPMVVTEIQGVIAAGQARLTDTLIDPQQVTQPGSLLVFLEPLYEGGLTGVTPGSSCIANAYSNNHDRLHSETLGFATRVSLHVIDAVAIVHAIILRIHAVILPFRILIFSGH